MKKVYVIGAHIQRGGALMAYHIGRIIQEEFGYEPIAVQVGEETADVQVFGNQTAFSSVSISMDQFFAAVKSEDVVVVNPSFSQYLIGLKTPATVILYVQGLTTYPVIDGFADVTVAVSDAVQHFLQRMYHMKTPVIPAFIDTDAIPTNVEWDAREKGSVATYLKWGGEHIFDAFQQTMQDLYPDIKLTIKKIHDGTPHQEVLASIADSQFFLALSPVEGFGLMPLEAMACGTVVVGFDGISGLHYMRPNKNAFVSRYPDIEGACHAFAKVVHNNRLARKAAQHGRNTALLYTYDRFRNDWIKTLTPVLT